jgi:hypothetical protein
MNTTSLIYLTGKYLNSVSYFITETRIYMRQTCIVQFSVTQLLWHKCKAIPVLNEFKYYAMKAYGEVDVLIHIFLTSALVGGEWSASRLGSCTPGERAPGIHWIGGWVDPRAGLDDLERRKFLTLPGLELRPLSRPARSQSLYRLNYDGTIISKWELLRQTTQLI